jgi:hypothetical protein
MNQTITAETRRKLIDIINAGLVSGLGTPRPGSLCVEAAICLAVGEPHSDRPSCVAQPDREFAVRINDAPWSSPEARAKALLPLALAQLGTAGSDRGPWVQRVAEGTIRQIVPIALRAAARAHPDEQHRAALEDAAIRCEREGTSAADAAAYAADAADANAATAAHAAARANAANAAHAAARANAAARHAADANAAANAANAAAIIATAAATPDAVLQLAVQIALDAYAAEGRA